MPSLTLSNPTSRQSNMFLWMLLTNSLPFINADNTDEGISIQNISIYWTVSAAMSGYVRQSLQLCQTMSDKLYSLSFIWWNVWWPRIFFHRFTLFSQFHQQHRQHWQSDILWRWTLAWVGLTNVFLESMVPLCSQMFLFDFSSQETAQIMDANGTTGAGFETFVWKLTLYNSGHQVCRLFQDRRLCTPQNKVQPFLGLEAGTLRTRDEWSRRLLPLSQTHVLFRRIDHRALFHWPE